MNTLALTVYLVGMDEDDAQGNLPYTDHEDAEDYNQAEYGGKATIYAATARLDFSTMEEV